MANTVSLGKLKKPYGVGAVIAAGTANDIIAGGSFAANLKAPGSRALRNADVVLLTVARGSVSARGKGSSSGYVHVQHSIVGTPLPTGATTAVDLNYLILSNPGSLPA